MERSFPNLLSHCALSGALDLQHSGHRPARGRRSRQLTLTCRAWSAAAGGPAGPRGRLRMTGRGRSPPRAPVPGKGQQYLMPLCVSRVHKPRPRTEPGPAPVFVNTFTVGRGSDASSWAVKCASTAEQRPYQLSTFLVKSATCNKGRQIVAHGPTAARCWLCQ